MRPATMPPAPRPRALPEVPMNDGWRQWIAENKLRGCRADSMLSTMTAHGLNRDACVMAMELMDRDPAFLAARRFQQLQRKLESVVGNLQRLWESAPDYGLIEKRSHVAPDEFVTRYIRGCRPLVLTGITHDWPAMARWSPEDLKHRFGQLEVEIQADRQHDPKFEENKLLHKRKVRLGDFVDTVLAGGATNDYYLTANNEVMRRPDFAPLLQDIGSIPPYCDRALLANSSSFWFGPAGTVTPLHHDTLMLFHTQVVGRKRWRFISPLETPRLYNHNGVFSPIDLDRPDLDRYPLLNGVTALEVVVEPGETVFLPLGWWHQVTSLDVSLSFSFSNLAVPNSFDYANPEIMNW